MSDTGFSGKEKERSTEATIHCMICLAVFLCAKLLLFNILAIIEVKHRENYVLINDNTLWERFRLWDTGCDFRIIFVLIDKTLGSESKAGMASGAQKALTLLPSVHLISFPSLQFMCRILDVMVVSSN